MTGVLLQQFCLSLGASHLELDECLSKIGIQMLKNEVDSVENRLNGRVSKEFCPGLLVFFSFSVLGYDRGLVLCRYKGKGHYFKPKHNTHIEPYGVPKAKVRLPIRKKALAFRFLEFVTMPRWTES
jgi:hypothetical protein